MVGFLLAMGMMSIALACVIIGYRIYVEYGVIIAMYAHAIVAMHFMLQVACLLFVGALWIVVAIWYDKRWPTRRYNSMPPVDLPLEVTNGDRHVKQNLRDKG